MAPATHAAPDDVPGTILLWDAAHADHAGGATRGEVVLQPQPSSDPEDPLNWSRPRKLRAIGMVYLYVLAVGICTTVQYSVLTPIAKEQNLEVGQLNLGTGLMFLFLGWGTLIWQPIALTYGRRGVYLTSLVLCIPPVVWTAFSRGASQWYAHRILIGIIAAPIESLPEMSVPDLFFAHERGAYMAFYTFMLFGSNFLAPLLAGFINDGAGWQWVMYFAAILLGVAAVVIFFFMEETIYFRAVTEGGVQIRDDKTAGQEVEQVDTREPVAKKSLRKRLALVTSSPGRPSALQTAQMVPRVFKILYWFPNIVWAGLLYGTNLAWYSVVNATMSTILGGEPYNFSPAMVGLSYASPLAFAAVASFWSGWFADSVALWMARRNNGVREPEHRLWALTLSALLSSVGLIMWGVGASRGLHFMVLIFGIGLNTFGVVCGGAISLAYTVDCFKEIAGESLIAVIIIRNTLGFAFNYAINPWIDSLGLQNCFISVAAISFISTSSFLVMIFWGKRGRQFSAGRYWSYVSKSQHQVSYTD